MKYLSKRSDSQVRARGLTYPRDRRAITAELLREQRQFCAYSEEHVSGTDAVDVEHFDPRRKNTPQDGYENWYAVRTQMHRWKPQRIQKHLPILSPASKLSERIEYVDDLFMPRDLSDTEARNLIAYLKWNRPELVERRKYHVRLIRDVLESGASWDEIQRRAENCSFATALAAHFGVDVSVNSQPAETPPPAGE
jgi:hypothetical protein